MVKEVNYYWIQTQHGEIISKTAKNINIPLTIKIRTGWDKKNIIAKELAKIAQKEGANGIIIHGRTREDFFGGEIDLNTIKEVKKIVDIPVIGNGNIKNAKDAKEMFDYTKVDGIMIRKSNTR